MIKKKPAEILNLYIDESGYYYIGQSKYKFFLLSATVIDPLEKDLADKLFLKWRKKHLIDPYRCLHASQFFEDHTKKFDYKRPELSMTRNFNNAVKELLEIISYLKFKSVVYYINIPLIRKRLGIIDPPLKLEKMTVKEEKEYKKIKSIYSQKIKLALADVRYIPLNMTINRAFLFHHDTMNEDQKSLKTGYINFESQSVSDKQLIKIFHEFKNKNSNYGEKIIGINLHTKRSLDAGIELSDFITYVSCQTLRFQFKLREELKDIPIKRHKILQSIRDEMREKFKIQIIDITKDLN